MSTCSACGAIFECGMTEGRAESPCWCTRLPTLPPEAYVRDASGSGVGCFCPDCLQALINRTRDRSAAGE
ncbi:cysteine-rich CWC family protein [Noviherbaspirillum aerium]|uniref:cysteine-rich CWC family protein n=1 Tax=Noviherbaspirillum aerium TaxID=2588497 RepID=UPI00124CDD3F|nr:cysteine-rich CWC family protein [Noviherbaspirillum aerium]